MLYAIGVIIFAVGLLLSIALHEVGHLLPAKKFGVKVTQYMVGFGATVWSRKRGDTEYGVKAIPLGGYIRMIGMVPPRADGVRSRWPRRMATAVEDFRQVSRAEVQPADQDREFYRLTPGKKMIVMLGGPTMNLIIYVLLTVLVLLTMGLPKQEATTTVGLVVRCVVPATSKAASANTCPKDAQAAPAYNRLKVGDVIESVNGVAVTSWSQLVATVEPSANKTLSVIVKRRGVDTTLSITPVSNLKYVGDSTTKTKEAGYLGISPTLRNYFASQSLLDVPRQIGSQLSVGVRALASYPQKLQNLWQTVFEGKKRDPQGAIGVVGIGRIGGQIAEDHQITIKDKAYTLISLLASVNLLLFLFNLLPLLPLDGGHVAGAIVEAARRGRARLKQRRERRHNPDLPRTHPQIFVDTAQMLPVMYGVASVLILVTLLTLYADIVSPISING